MRLSWRLTGVASAAAVPAASGGCDKKSLMPGDLCWILAPEKGTTKVFEGKILSGGPPFEVFYELEKGIEIGVAKYRLQKRDPQKEKPTAWGTVSKSIVVQKVIEPAQVLKLNFSIASAVPFQGIFQVDPRREVSVQGALTRQAAVLDVHFVDSTDKTVTCRDPSVYLTRLLGPAPPTLFVIIDRGPEDWRRSREKCKKAVRFVAELKIPFWRQDGNRLVYLGDETYEVIAIAQHLGAFADQGHYVAWTKSEKMWYVHNDGAAAFPGLLLNFDVEPSLLVLQKLPQAVL